MKRIAWVGSAFSLLGSMTTGVLADGVNAVQAGPVAGNSLPMASTLPMVVLIGCVAICFGTLLLMFRRAAAAVATI